MIPKVIHYCWFGRGKLPETAVKCIESWRKYCPDYEIKEWNEDNFSISDHEYAKRAYEEKKYAFVSDYARYYILEENGGIYMDVDVELVKGLDQFMQYELFFGRQDDGNINPGLIMGGEAHNWFLKKALDFYNNIDFDINNLNYNIVKITTDILCEIGFGLTDQTEEFKNIKVFSSKYFCPISYLTGELIMSDETVSIHHFDGSWLTDKEKERHEDLNKKIKRFGKKLGIGIWVIQYSVVDNGIVETIKRMMRKMIKRSQK